MLTRMGRLRPLAARLRAARLEVDERLGDESEARDATRTVRAYAARHGEFIPLTGEGLLRVLECSEEPPGPSQLGMAPATIEATATAVAHLTGQARGAVMVASVGLVSTILRMAPLIWWLRQGRAEHEPYRIRPGEEWTSLAVVLARLRANDAPGAYAELPGAASILVERASRDHSTLLGVGPHLDDFLSEIEAIRAAGVRLSGRVRPGLRYETWAATIGRLDEALAAIEAAHTGNA